MRPESVLRGSERYNSKLKESQIPEIKKLLSVGKSRQWVAMKFGVKKAAIQRIAEGVGWTHV